MAINLSALDKLQNVALTVGNLTVVQPKPNSYTPKINGIPQQQFLFHTEGENSIHLESEITEHYTEDNTHIVDQVALKPEIVSVTGYIGELNDVIPFYPEIAKFIKNKLQVLSPLAPQLTNAALNVFNKAYQIYQTADSVINSVNSAIDTISSGQQTGPKSKQQEAFASFYGFYLNRRLFDVQTPWFLFQNMVIRSIRICQNEDTKSISTFEITFKKINFAKTAESGGTQVDDLHLPDIATPQQSKKILLEQQTTISNKIGSIA